MQECVYEIKKLIRLLENEEEKNRYVFGKELHDEYLKVLKKEKRQLEETKKQVTLM